jgi:hypothetical protein
VLILLSVLFQFHYISVLYFEATPPNVVFLCFIYDDKLLYQLSCTCGILWWCSLLGYLIFIDCILSWRCPLGYLILYWHVLYLKAAPPNVDLVNKIKWMNEWTLPLNLSLSSNILGTKEDLWNTVPPKMAQRVLAGMLNESLTILAVRYTQV